MSLQVFDTSVSPGQLIQTNRLGGVPFFVQSNAVTNEVYAMVAYDRPEYATPMNLEVFSAKPTGATLKYIALIGNTDDGGAIWASQTNGKVYVAETHDNQLQVFDPKTYLLLQTVPMTDPFAIAEDPGLGRIYISNPNTNAITLQ
jgi:DNA-binding beta-propeller fold protein YncE